MMLTAYPRYGLSAKNVLASSRTTSISIPIAKHSAETSWKTSVLSSIASRKIPMTISFYKLKISPNLSHPFKGRCLGNASLFDKCGKKEKTLRNIGLTSLKDA